jgi:hypothetical protein
MAKPVNFLTPVPQIIRELQPALAETILVYAQEENRESFVSLIELVGATLKFRPGIWRTWPKTRQREWLWTNLRQATLSKSALYFLQEWFFSQRTKMLNQFLDVLGVKHNPEGYIEEQLPDALDAEKVREGVDALLKEYPAPEVALYLKLFQYGREGGWESIASVLDTEARFKA